MTASDRDGLTAGSSFDVTVVTSGSGFHIELVFATAMTPTQRGAFERAAERWMTILAPTELPDFVANRTLTCGDDPAFSRYVETIDDLMIVAAVREIDGPAGTLAAANWCWARPQGLFPFYGRMVFDSADLERMEAAGDIEEVVLHEIGHVLGIGTLWEEHDLLANPSLPDNHGADTHFQGRLAVAAFDDAGGTAYTDGKKVPVENRLPSGSGDSHWRESVLHRELMTPSHSSGVSNPLSAITIQSLADLGYAVDVTAAEPYQLPGPDAARTEPHRLIHFGNDILRGPRVIVDADGRIVRVIPG